MSDYDDDEERITTGGRERKSLHRVTIAYGEDRDNVIIKEYLEVADSGEYAELQVVSKNPFPKEWDKDFLTVKHQKITDVWVKRKPNEILTAKSK